jgi:hypothetical protein
MPDFGIAYFRAGSPGIFLELGDTGRLANGDSIKAIRGALIGRQTSPPRHKYVTDCA